MFLACSNLVFSQLPGNTMSNLSSTDKILDNDYLRNSGSNIISNSINYAEVSGSPYENETFQLGKVSNKLNDNVQNYLMRYNIFTDEMEIQANDDKTNSQLLIKSKNIHVLLNKKEYHYESYQTSSEKINEGYFIVKYKGENCSLFEKKNKVYQAGKPARDSFHQATPAKFKDSDEYYYKINETLVPLSNNKNSILKEFSNKESDLKNYMKAEKLDVKKEADLIKLIQYYDSVL